MYSKALNEDLKKLFNKHSRSIENFLYFMIILLRFIIEPNKNDCEINCFCICVTFNELKTNLSKSIY